MKTKLKTTYLLGLSLLAGIGCILNLANGATTLVNIDVTDVNSGANSHRARVYSLFLGDGTCNGLEDCKSLLHWTGAWMGMREGGDRLDILNGLFVSSLSGVSSTGSLVAIGGGSGNRIRPNVSNSGIGGGVANRINGDNSAIGGGFKNIAGNSSVVVGGQQNQADNGGVVAGGYNSKAKHVGTIILGNNGETYGSNAMLLSSAAKGGTGSFVWGGEVNDNGPFPVSFAKIKSTSGVLIGTYKPINGLSLVVSGTIKIGDDYSTSNKQKGEILVDNQGCIYVYDNQNQKRNAIGRISRKSGGGAGCQTGSTCIFGRTLLQDGDKATAYTSFYSNNCSNVKRTVTCENGTLKPNGTNVTYYPYCYNL